ncbi:MAG: hypothetical protein ACTSR8_10090 [Promethearchaeota archaeon]
MNVHKCYTCGKVIGRAESKHAVYKVTQGEQKHVGYDCTNCYFKSLPDEVWEGLDKYQQGI